MKNWLAIVALVVVGGALIYLVTLSSPASEEMTPEETTPAEAEVRQDIIDRLDVYQEAVMGGDLQTVASFWTSDARIMIPGMDLAGADLHAHIEEVFPTQTISDVGDDLVELFVHGDVAYGIYKYWQTVQIEGQEPESMMLNCFMRWEMEDGVWKIDRDVCGPVDAPSAG